MKRAEKTAGDLRSPAVLLCALPAAFPGSAGLRDKNHIERKLVNLVHHNPADIIMLAHLRDALSDGGVEQGQMDGQIRVFVRHFGKGTAHGYRDCKLLAAFAHECLFFGLTVLHLAANEFPQQTTRLMCRALADHEPAALPDQGSDYFCHVCFLLSWIFRFSIKEFRRFRKPPHAAGWIAAGNMV